MVPRHSGRRPHAAERKPCGSCQRAAWPPSTTPVLLQSPGRPGMAWPPGRLRPRAAGQLGRAAGRGRGRHPNPHARVSDRAASRRGQGPQGLRGSRWSCPTGSKTALDAARIALILRRCRLALELARSSPPWTARPCRTTRTGARGARQVGADASDEALVRALAAAWGRPAGCWTWRAACSPSSASWRPNRGGLRAIPHTGRGPPLTNGSRK